MILTLNYFLINVFFLQMFYFSSARDETLEVRFILKHQGFFPQPSNLLYLFCYLFHDLLYIYLIPLLQEMFDLIRLYLINSFGKN